jgi:GxxExxY protein
MKTNEELEAIAKIIVDAIIQVHRTLGPGLMESTYQKCLEHELRKRGIIVHCEVTLPVNYDGIKIESGYRIDMLVENAIIIENKMVESILPVHKAQLLTYLKLSNCKIGFLLNWNVALMKNGITRMVNNL